MKKYHQYKNLKQAANAFVRTYFPGSISTELTVSLDETPTIVRSVSPGYRKKTTNEYVPKKYLSNFGWKNTYYQHAVNEVLVPIEWYLWFGWKI